MKFSAVALLPSIALAAPADLVTRQAPPGGVTIRDHTYSGNGCPGRSVSAILSPDRSTITFGFDAFQAVYGPNTKSSDWQKNCQLHLELKYPQGFQVSLMTATYHGYVRLDDGVSASFLSNYFFSNNAGTTASSRTTISGPEYKNGKIYTKQDKIENASMVWSECGGTGILNVNNRIALNGRRDRSGEISNDDATIKFEQKLSLQWRSCRGNKRFAENGESSLGDFNSTTIELA